MAPTITDFQTIIADLVCDSEKLTLLRMILHMGHIDASTILRNQTNRDLCVLALLDLVQRTYSTEDALAAFEDIAVLLNMQMLTPHVPLGIPGYGVQRCLWRYLTNKSILATEYTCLLAHVATYPIHVKQLLALNMLQHVHIRGRDVTIGAYNNQSTTHDSWLYIIIQCDISIEQFTVALYSTVDLFSISSTCGFQNFVVLDGKGALIKTFMDDYACLSTVVNTFPEQWNLVNIGGFHNTPYAVNNENISATAFVYHLQMFSFAQLVMAWELYGTTCRTTDPIMCTYLSPPPISQSVLVDNLISNIKRIPTLHTGLMLSLIFPHLLAPTNEPLLLFETLNSRQMCEQTIDIVIKHIRQMSIDEQQQVLEELTTVLIIPTKLKWGSGIRTVMRSYVKGTLRLLNDRTILMMHISSVTRRMASKLYNNICRLCACTIPMNAYTREVEGVLALVTALDIPYETVYVGWLETVFHVPALSSSPTIRIYTTMHMLFLQFRKELHTYIHKYSATLAVSNKQVWESHMLSAATVTLWDLIHGDEPILYGDGRRFSERHVSWMK